MKLQHIKYSFEIDRYFGGNIIDNVIWGDSSVLCGQYLISVILERFKLMIGMNMSRRHFNGWICEWEGKWINIKVDIWKHKELERKLKKFFPRAYFKNNFVKKYFIIYFVRFL